MKQQLHTPGPWSNGGKNRHFGFSIHAPGSKPEYHVTVCEVMGQDQDETTASNTSLILAAPDMYEALKALLWAVEQHTNLAYDYPAFVESRAAIAKAEGIA